MVKIVIIGNSAAAFSSASSLPQQIGVEITLITQEACPAYKKNLLIELLCAELKEEEIFFCNVDFYKRRNINFLKSAEVVKLDIKKQRLTLKDNSKVNYEYLIIACGAKTVIPDLPGKSKLGVSALNNLDDVQKIRARLAVSSTVCLLGSMASCLKLASFFLSKNKEVKIFSGSALDSANHQDGLELIADAWPQEFIGEGQLQAIKLDNGKVIGTTLAVYVGTAIPATEFLQDAGISLEQGYILVDQAMRTNIENIFACGNVCRNNLILSKEKTCQEAACEGILAAQEVCKSIERGNLLCQRS